MSVADEQPRADRFNAVRERVKEAEWWLPVSLQRPLLRLFGGRFDPYSEWNHAHRAIFIHIPRTAGTSIARALATSKNHFTCSRYAAFDPAAYRNYFKFGFVRNPWDRLLSAFTRLREAMHETSRFEVNIWARQHLAAFVDFEQFVCSLRDPVVGKPIIGHSHFRPQLDWVSLPGSSRIELDFVGRFESLASDFKEIAMPLSVQQDLPITNASSHGAYREMFTPKMRDIAADIYKADIAAFDYEF